MTKNEFLHQYIFHGLRDLNSGFDAESIAYFSEEEFAIVLDRIEQHGCGIYGIEPFLDQEYFDTEVVETNGGNPCDPAWYRGAFESFRNFRSGLEYSASYYVPDALLGEVNP